MQEICNISWSYTYQCFTCGSRKIVVPPNSNTFFRLEYNMSLIRGQNSLTCQGEQNSLTPQGNNNLNFIFTHDSGHASKKCGRLVVSSWDHSNKFLQIFLFRVNVPIGMNQSLYFEREEGVGGGWDFEPKNPYLGG